MSERTQKIRRRARRARKRQRVFARVERHRQWMLALSTLSVLGGGGLALVCATNPTPTEWGDYAMLIGMPFAAVLALAKRHRHRTTSLVMPYVLSRLKARLGQDPFYVFDANFHTAILEASGLVNTADEVETRHLVTSRLPTGDSLSLCNVTTYRVTGSGVRKKRYVADQGIFVDRKTALSTGIDFVIRDRSLFNRKTIQAGKHGGTRLSRVDKLHPAFDRHYLVYTSDPVRTLRFLSPNVLERFMTLARQKGHVAELALFDDQLYLFLNKADISIPRIPLWRATSVRDLTHDAWSNFTDILDMIDLIHNEQRLLRLDNREGALPTDRNPKDAHATD